MLEINGLMDFLFLLPDARRHGNDFQSGPDGLGGLGNEEGRQEEEGHHHDGDEKEDDAVQGAAEGD